MKSIKLAAIFSVLTVFLLAQPPAIITRQGNPKTDVQENLQKYLTYFDVKNYGAIGDSITDNTLAIRACRNALVKNGGGVMYFPKGIFKITDSIRFPLLTPITVEGVGISPTWCTECGSAEPYGVKNANPDIPIRSVTKVISTMQDKPAFEFYAGNSASKIEFQYAGSTPVAGNTAIRMVAGYGFNWTSVASYNYYAGLRVDGDNGEYTLFDCHTYGAWHEGIVLGNPIHNDFADNNLINCTFRAVGHDADIAIHVISGGGNKLTNVKFNSSPAYNNVGGFDTKYAQWRRGVYIESTVGPTAEFEMVNCGLASWIGPALEVTGPNPFYVIKLHGNIFSTGTGQSPAIVLGSNTARCSISDNYISNNGIPSTIPAIRINANDNAVHHNQIYDYAIKVENNGSNNVIDEGGSNSNFQYDAASKTARIGEYVVGGQAVQFQFNNPTDKILDIVPNYYGSGRGAQNIRMGLTSLGTENYNISKVGIGNSADLTHRLNVFGNSKFLGSMYTALDADSFLTVGIRSLQMLQQYSIVQPKMWVSGTGAISDGLFTPRVTIEDKKYGEASQLYINSSGDTVVQGIGGVDGRVHYKAKKSDFVISVRKGKFILSTDSTYNRIDFLMDKTGKIGVGTENPTNTLDVNGGITARFTQKFENVTIVPTAAPSSGCLLYSDGNFLKYWCAGMTNAIAFPH